ncbi:MAG: hypothetical protein MAG431_00010 [Chloroflexi bacterium]|nr:hypothetical protein [Chloroflexota bacterium]
MENRYYVIAKFVDGELKNQDGSWDAPTCIPGSWKEGESIFLSTLEDILADFTVFPYAEGPPMLFRAEFKGKKQGSNLFSDDDEYAPEFMRNISVGTSLGHHIRDSEGFHNIVNNARLLYRVTTWNLKNLIKFNVRYLEESERTYDVKYKYNNIEYIKSLSEIMIECNYRPALSLEESSESLDKPWLYRDWYRRMEKIDKRKEFLIDTIANFEKSNNIKTSYLNNPIKKLLSCTSIKEAIGIATRFRNSVSLLKLSDEIGKKQIYNTDVEENSDLLSQFASMERHLQASLLSEILGETK